MNEYEDDDLILNVVFFDLETDEEASTTMTATRVDELTEEQSSSFASIMKSIPTFYNYIHNFEFLNIDNEIFYIDKLLSRDDYGSVDPAARSPYTTNNTDGGKYLQLFTVLNTKTLSSDMLTRSEVAVARHCHYLGDIRYGSNTFDDRDNASFNVYFPSMRAAAKDITYREGYDGSNHYCVASLSKEEAGDLGIKFGPITGSSTSHIEERFQEMSTDLYETIISRENIPNIIPNNSKLSNIEDLMDEGTSGIVVSSISTTTSY